MFLLIATLVLGAAQEGLGHGPVFLLEPPAHLTFSNTSGSQLSCSADGSPVPQVDWMLQGGQAVTAVPGLRQSLGNGTLYFPPFRAEDYRKDVHATVYRCRASNLVGTILSRDVHVRAVVNQHYEVQVYHTHVLAGNTAVMGCVIPVSVKEHVTVTSWTRDESILLPGFNMGGRLTVTHGTGELHIRSARAEDGLARYSCLTLHSLTQERKRSAPAILTVTEPTGSMPPRLVPSVQTSVSADQETDVHLTCAAQGNPPPTYEWFRESDGHLQPVSSSGRFEPSQEVLFIRRLRLQDEGRWTCKVSNHFGEQRLDIHLTVTAHLTVHILPQLQVINSGENAFFNCTVSGSPMGRVQWYKNGEPLAIESNNIKLLSSMVLMVERVTRHDRGMYQCMVQNDREMAQGSAELRLGDTVPELQLTFSEQALRPGTQVSLRCSAMGSPPPHFRWFLDGEPLPDLSPTHRYTISQYVDHDGDVISHLNISNLRVEDGGRYTCRAVNSLGSIEHSARINVYGPPFIRTLGPTRAVAGADVTLHCPYSGYPVSPVRWERHDQELPLDLRHKLEDDGSLTISRLDQTADSGFYTCSVSNHEGDVAKRDVQLVVHSPPILEPFSFPTSLQEGGRAQVTCYVTSGDMPIYFSWFKDNEPIPATLQIKERAAEFYSMLIFKEVSSRHSGSYTCVVSNAAAKANYTAQLMVKVAPQWIVEPQDASTLSGNPILLQCSADGFPKPQITWLKAKGLTVGNYQPLISSSGVMELLMNGSLWLLSASPDDEGYYLCRATNGIGSGIGKVIYLGVNEPVRFEIAMKNISVRRGNSATLTCDIHGDTPIQVVWMFNGNRLDPNNYRYTISNLNIEHGLKSQVIIIHADREDSGVYKCLAENVFGHSEHVINLIVQERPDPPNMLEILEVFSRSVRLAWRRPFDGNSPIIGYVVQYQVLNTGQSDHQPVVYNITLPSNSLPNINEPQQRENAVINRLEPATVYTMRMLAVNSIDHSQFTEALVVKTQEEEPSGAPQDVHVEPIGPSELLVSWAIPLRNTWNGELLGYIVSWNEHGASWNRSRKITVKGWATTKVQLTGLKKFTRYDINVCAFNSISSGPPSPTVLATTKEGAPEAPPRDVQCSQISSQSMKISWTPPPPETHAGLIQGYKVYYRPTFNKYIDIPITGEVKRTPSTETYLHGLYKFTNYSIKVLAFTGAGDGVMSNVIYCTTDEDVPGPPAAIKASALTGESILISWLAPVKPNGRITQYTVYSREAGRVGKHITHPVRIEESHSDVDETYGLGLSYEVRGLTEHQLYEFWVSATTGTGEGESTPIVAQATNSRAPSKIASFDQVLHIPVNSKVLLPCLAVGNPTPRTRWIHRDRPVTFSPYYQVTATGHLSIHGIDQNLEGNYTCSAKNLFGEDNITYVLFVITPPSAPNLEVQFATTRSFRLHWTQPDDGGAAIQGYTVNIKHESGDWTSLELSAEHTVYTVDNLRCGSLYHTYIVAHNRVGSGNPSTILSVHTKGGPPSPPRDNDFITTNSTSMNLNLEGWPDGGCPIARFSIHYKILGMKDWMLVSSSYSDKHIIIDDLLPATWYQIQIVAENDAGLSEVLLNFATTTLLGAHILPPPVSFNNTSSNDFIYTEVIIIVSAVLAGILLFILFFWFAVHYFGSRRRTEYSDDADRPHEIHSDKTVERDNQKNCQQVYTSSPIKKNHKIQDDGSGMYEISPYATFSVPGSNSHGRSVTTSTLDYSMHFKTFGHIDDDDLNHRMESDLYPRDVYPKTPNKHSWHKHRYCGSEGLYPKFESPREDLAQNEYIIGQKKMRLCSNHLSNRDSESDDTSGSPCTESAAAGSASAAYHLPVKSSKDLFRPDSSTESYDVSPPLERRQVPGTRTPHHVGPSRRHRPSSSSSEEDEYVKKTSECLSPSPPPPPPSEFLDSREFSEAECDRDLQLSKMSIELTSLISRYQEQKEQERKEFTIFV